MSVGSCLSCISRIALAIVSESVVVGASVAEGDCVEFPAAFPEENAFARDGGIAWPLAVELPLPTGPEELLLDPVASLSPYNILASALLGAFLPPELLADALLSVGLPVPAIVVEGKFGLPLPFVPSEEVVPIKEPLGAEGSDCENSVPFFPLELAGEGATEPLDPEEPLVRVDVNRASPISSIIFQSLATEFDALCEVSFSWLSRYESGARESKSISSISRSRS